MFLELSADYGASVPAPLAMQSIAWVKKELELRSQPTQGNKKLLLERLKDEMNRKLVRNSTLEEDKSNIKSKKKKKVGNGGGMKLVCMKQFPSTSYWKVL